MAKKIKAPKFQSNLYKKALRQTRMLTNMMKNAYRTSKVGKGR